MSRTFSLYKHGCTVGTPPTKNDHQREKRGTVQGWSHGACRRNTQFLRSVQEEHLHTDSQGNPLNAMALTLTLKECPDTSDRWHRLRRSFLKRCERRGLYRCHWVTEWQKRGVPHLHGAFWFPKDVSPWDVLKAWTEAASEYGALLGGQYCLPITDPVGWFKYLSKHASRGVSHYQRSPENIPEGWKGKTGRVWGKTGDWPTQEVVKIDLDDQAYFAFRRIVRRWRISDSRSTGVRDAVALARRKEPPLKQAPFHVVAKRCGAYRRLQSARRMLKCNSSTQSSVRGVSEWIDQDTQLLILDHLRASGFSVIC